MGGELQLVGRWFLFGSAMILFGSALFPFYAGDGAAARARLLLPRPVTAALALTALAAALLWLLGFAAGLGDPEDLAGTLRAVLFESGFGPVWLARLAATVLLVAASVRGRPGPIAALALAVLLCEGWSGHAATWGAAGSVTQAVHVVCAGAWIGGLVSLARLVAAARRRPSETAAAVTALWRFSRLGIALVIAIAATGLMSTWRMLGALPDLADTYDRVLLAKIGLFGLMVLVAVLNRAALARLARSEPGPSLKALARNIALEQVLAAAVLLAVSGLGLMNPSL